MSILREDYVSIGFNIIDDPLNDLVKGINDIKKSLGILEETELGLTDVEKEAKKARKEMKGLGDSIHAPPLTKTAEETEGLGTEAKKTKKLFGSLVGMVGELADVSMRPLVSGMKSLASHAGSAAKALGGASLKGLKTTAKGVAVGVTTAATALSVGAVAAFNYGSAFETSLAKVSTMVDTTVIDLQGLGNEVLKLSNETGEGAAGLNEAVYQALSAGADSAQVIDLVGTAVKAAKGGFTDTTTAIDGLTSVLNAYGMATSDADGLANQFLITQNKGKTTFGELASSIGGVAPTANAAGVGIDELLSGVASLTANGIGTSEAMTGVKAALSNVIKPSAEAEKTAKQLGVEFNTTALQSKGLVGFLDDVKKATGGNMDQMAQLFGSVEALNTVLTLTSDNGMSLMKDTMSEMSSNTTALTDAYDTMSDTAQNSVQKGLNSFKNLGIGLFQESEGLVSEFVGLFARSGQELYDAFADGGTDALVKQIGSTLSNGLVTITGYLPNIVDGGVNIINALIQGVTENKDALAQSIASALKNLTTGLLKATPALLAVGAEIFASVLQGIAQDMPLIVSTAVEAIQVLTQGLLSNLPLIIESGVTILSGLMTGLIQAAPLLISAGIQLIVSLAEGLISNIDLLVNGAVELILALSSGLLDNIPLLIDATVMLVTGLVNGLVNNMDLVIDGAISLINGLFTGLIQNLPLLVQAANQLTMALIGGLIQSIPLLIEATPKLVFAIMDTIMATDWIDVGLNIVKGIGTGLVDGIKGLLGKNKESGKESAQSLADGLAEGSSNVGNSAGKTSELVTHKIDQTNLYGSGQNIMSGLNDGMNSMQGTLNTTAGNIGNGISKSLNGSLDIHSPSRVTEETGRYTGLGLANGIAGTKGVIQSTAAGIGRTAAQSISPVKSRYSPSGNTMPNNNSSSVNHYSPVFNLTLNGASASDSNERKVKRWIKESVNETLRGIARTNPKIKEV